MYSIRPCYLSYGIDQDDIDFIEQEAMRDSGYLDWLANRRSYGKII